MTKRSKRIIPDGFLFSPTPSAEYPYYVYELLRPDGSVFYVGKGKGGRMSDHAIEARANHACHKCNTIRKIWSEGGEVGGRIVYVTNSETGAYRFEARLIAYYGIENLTNIYSNDERAAIERPAKRPTKEERERRRQERITYIRGELQFLSMDLRSAKRMFNEEWEREIKEDIEMYKLILKGEQSNFI